MDDRIYAALLYEPKHRCLVKELGKQGEILNTTVDFPRDATADKLIIYVLPKMPTVKMYLIRYVYKNRNKNFKLKISIKRPHAN